MKLDMLLIVVNCALVDDYVIFDVCSINAGRVKSIFVNGLQQPVCEILRERL